MAEHLEYEARTVRPYAVTGGRVKSARSDLPLEALVEQMPGAVAGTAFAGLAALAVGTAAPAGAQQVKPAQPAVSTATPQQATLSQGCGWWDDDCDWWDNGWDSWGYWDSWGW